ncbi:MAG TPA: hypothetical protein VE153_21495 [Myxococcus sp.]|nr:hypothetical protein [Myxococcus sp.]
MMYDKSVTFPVSPAREVVKVGAPGQVYELDGEVLRAVEVAANDLFPSGLPVTVCRNKREAHTFRFRRQEDIVFIYIDEDPAYCGRRYASLDSGAKYAVHTDGRILRRIVEGIDEDDGVWRLKTPDGGRVTVITEPGVIPDMASPGAPDSGVLKVIPEPMDASGVPVIERLAGGSQAEVAGPGATREPTLPPWEAGGVDSGPSLNQVADAGTGADAG